MAAVTAGAAAPRLGEVSRIWRGVSVAALACSVLVILSVERLPVEAQHAPDSQSYAQLADSLTHGRYEVTIPGEPEGSRYPPGLPLLLAPFSSVDPGTLAVGWAVLLLGVVWGAAKRLGGHPAAAVAVLIMVSSSTLRSEAQHLMADTPAAVLTVAAVAAVSAGRDRLAGLLVAAVTWVRLVQVVLVFGLRRRGVAVVLVALVGLLATKLMWGWGYRSADAAWSLDYLWTTEGLANPEAAHGPNVIAYPAMLLGLTGGVTLPGAFVLAALGLRGRRERRLVVAAVVGVLLVTLPYFYQAGRFLLPVAALIAMYAGAWISDLLRTPDLRPPVEAIVGVRTDGRVNGVGRGVAQTDGH